MKQFTRPPHLRGMTFIWPDETLVATKLGGWWVSEADRISPWAYAPDAIMNLRRTHSLHQGGLLQGAELFCARLEGHPLRGIAVFMNPRAPGYDAIMLWGHMHRDESLSRWQQALHARAQHRVWS